MSNDKFAPRPEHKFTFGLARLSNRRLRRRQGFCARLYADLFNFEGEGETVE